MQLREFAKLTEPVGPFVAGTIGRIVGRCIDESAFVLELGPHDRVAVGPRQIEPVRGYPFTQ